MSFEIIPTETFERKLKKLAKKHKSLKNVFAPLGCNFKKFKVLKNYTLRVQTATK